MSYCHHGHGGSCPQCTAEKESRKQQEGLKGILEVLEIISQDIKYGNRPWWRKLLEASDERV